MNAALCTATTLAGPRCRNRARNGAATCHHHDNAAPTAGRVYALASKGVTGIKVGFTHGRAADRAAALNTTSVPLPFEVVHESVSVDNPREVEQAVFERLAASRVAPNREFFDVTAEEAAAAITACATPTPTRSEVDVPVGVTEVLVRFANSLTITVSCPAPC